MESPCALLLVADKLVSSWDISTRSELGSLCVGFLSYSQDVCTYFSKRDTEILSCQDKNKAATIYLFSQGHQENYYPSISGSL